MKVHTVKHLPPPFIGMNGRAAKALGFPWRFGKDDVAVLAGLTPRQRRGVMKRGKGYFAADMAAPRLVA